MQQILLILDVVFAIALVGLILIQQGKGATMGSGFGGGASQTVFGSQGAGSFMVKITAAFAVLFFVTSLYLGHLAGKPQQSQSTSVLDKVSQISKAEKTQQAAAAKAASELSGAASQKSKQP